MCEGKCATSLVCGKVIVINELKFIFWFIEFSFDEGARAVCSG